MVFIDLDEAYDRVPRQEVWRCMREKGVPDKYVRIVKDTYYVVEERTTVESSVGLTSTMTVRVGLRQGSSLSPYIVCCRVRCASHPTAHPPLRGRLVELSLSLVERPLSHVRIAYFRRHCLYSRGYWANNLYNLVQSVRLRYVREDNI